MIVHQQWESISELHTRMNRFDYSLREDRSGRPDVNVISGFRGWLGETGVFLKPVSLGVPSNRFYSVEAGAQRRSSPIRGGELVAMTLLQVVAALSRQAGRDGILTAPTSLQRRYHNRVPIKMQIPRAAKREWVTRSPASQDRPRVARPLPGTAPTI